MRPQSISLIAGLFGAATAIPCSDFGIPGDDLFTGIHPFDPPLGQWDVVAAADCFVRWNRLRPRQRRSEARHTQTVWAQTPEAIRATIQDYDNVEGNNIPLWFPLTTRALQYSHMLTYNIKDFTPIDPQSSLSDTSIVEASIILPRGRQQLTQVRAKRSEDNDQNGNVDRTEEMGITGIRGTIELGDYAYISGSELQLAVKSMYEEQKAAFYSRTRYQREKFAYALAEKANGDCVVIDFRDFEEWVIRMPPNR